MDFSEEEFIINYDEQGFHDKIVCHLLFCWIYYDVKEGWSMVDDDQDLARNHQEELKMQQKEEEAQKSNPPKDKYRKYKTLD